MSAEASKITPVIWNFHLSEKYPLTGFKELEDRNWEFEDLDTESEDDQNWEFEDLDTESEDDQNWELEDLDAELEELKDRNRILKDLMRKLEARRRPFHLFEYLNHDYDDSPDSKTDGQQKTQSESPKSFGEKFGSSWLFRRPFNLFEGLNRDYDDSPDSKTDGQQKTQSESPKSTENRILKPTNSKRYLKSVREENMVSSYSTQGNNEVLKIRSFIVLFIAASKLTRTLLNFAPGSCLLFLLTFASTLMPGYAKIIISPKDVETVQGTSATFNCSSSIPATYVQWNHYPIGKSMKVIYAYGKISSEHEGRFAVQNGHNLNISSVTVDDAGTYECHDDYGHGERQGAELIVIANNPICESNTNLNKVVGSNTWGIEPSQVILSCYVEYQGKTAPALKWKKNDEEEAVTSGVSDEVRGNRFFHNLTLKGDTIADGTSYNCFLAKAASLATCDSGRITIIDESAVNSRRESSHINVTVIIYICVIICLGSVSCVLAIIVWKIKKQTGKRMSHLNGKDWKQKEMENQADGLQAHLKDPESQQFHQETAFLPEKQCQLM